MKEKMISVFVIKFDWQLFKLTAKCIVNGFEMINWNDMAKSKADITAWSNKCNQIRLSSVIM